MQTRSERDSKSDRSLESAPALVVALGAYLILAAIFATLGKLVPGAISWGAYLAIAVLTSRSMTLGWSVYNGIAAALFFSSIIVKPYGELHFHAGVQWAAATAIVAVAVVSSRTSHSAITWIRDVLTSKEQAWRT